MFFKKSFENVKKVLKTSKSFKTSHQVWKHQETQKLWKVFPVFLNASISSSFQNQPKISKPTQCITSTHNTFLSDHYRSDPVESSKHTKSILLKLFYFFYFIMHHSRSLDLVSLISQIFRIRRLLTTMHRCVGFIAIFTFSVSCNYAKSLGCFSCLQSSEFLP